MNGLLDLLKEEPLNVLEGSVKENYPEIYENLTDGLRESQTICEMPLERANDVALYLGRFNKYSMSDIYELFNIG